MCIMLYVQLMWCSGLPWIYGQLEGVVLPVICQVWCSGIQGISTQVGGQSVKDPWYTITHPPAN